MIPRPAPHRLSQAKLTEAEVRAIRLLRSARPRLSLRTLAKQFHVSHTAIRRAESGDTWRHVEGET